MSLLANRYSKALFAAASEKGAVDAVLADLEAIGKTLSDPQNAVLVTAPDIPSHVRRQAIDRLVDDRHELTRGFAAVLLERRRQELLCDVHRTFRALVLEQKNQVEGVVESPKELSDEQLTSLESLAGKLVGKTVILTQKTVPELLGGVRLRVGNTLYDGSVATALEDLHRKLLAVPVG